MQRVAPSFAESASHAVEVSTTTEAQKPDLLPWQRRRVRRGALAVFAISPKFHRAPGGLAFADKRLA